MLVQTCLLVYVLSVVDCAKILAVFPTPSISHQVVFRTLTKELVKRGHEVTVLTPDPAYPNDAPKNIIEIDVHDVSYGFLRAILDVHSVTDNLNQVKVNENMVTFMMHLFEMQLKSSNVQQLVYGKTKQFDLILLESIVRPALVLTHVFKVPTILITSLGGTNEINDVFGIPTHPILYPSPFNKRIYNLTYWESFINLYYYLAVRSALNNIESLENTMLQKHFGTDVPPLNELYNNVDMFFVNVHPIWVDNQPVPSNVVFMGGIHQIESKELPQELQTYLDSSKHGVIYISFGTNALASSIPKEKVEIIANVMSELPYDVLWKWDQDNLPVSSTNIKLSKWLPQADLLKHPNIKLFVTQAGLQSTDEAITAGVPLVAIPMLGDQWYNAEKYVFHGIGKKLLIEDLNKEDLKKAVELVIKDKSYRHNILKLREIMRDQLEPPLERAMFWIEYVLRHKGAKHLRAPSANLSWPQYLQINTLLIALLLLIIASVIIAIILIFIRKLFKKIKNKIKRS